MAAELGTRPRSLCRLEHGQLRCPGCEAVGSAALHFKPLDMNGQYREELVTVFMHRRDRGGCGHVFAPRFDPYFEDDYVERRVNVG